MSLIRLASVARAFLLVCLVALPTAATLAVDGVIEINHARAMQGGITPADTAGYPVTLSEAGSYRLTGNLDVPAGARGIAIQAEHVTLDLNGFAISGGGDSNGIYITAQHVHVSNGSVSGFFRGVESQSLGAPEEGPLGIVLENLSVSNNAHTGIFLESRGARIESCRAFDNGANGISVSWGAIIKNNVACNNVFAGISADVSTISGNSTHENGDFGIYCGGSCTITGNNVFENVGSGIATSSASAVLDNTVRSNGGYGLSLGTASGYARNVIRLNSGGTVTGGVEMGVNVCETDTTCP